jgi:lipoprotein NlpD
MISFILRPSLLIAAAAVLAACSSTPPPAPRPAPARPAPAPSPAPAPAPSAPAQPAAFIRPAEGPTLARFDGKGNKGLDIGGKAGDPVLASADGRVVFVGGQLRGYGNMVIVKHNDTFLTAYAHAQKILVKEKDTVRQGQQIAEMGKSGTDRVKLHFEVRKQGVAVDPQPYLDGKAR